MKNTGYSLLKKISSSNNVIKINYKDNLPKISLLKNN